MIQHITLLRLVDPQPRFRFHIKDFFLLFHFLFFIFISWLNPFAGRWNAPADNGASIQQFILECDEGLGGQPAHFVPVFEGRAKQYNVARLLPSTLYK